MERAIISVLSNGSSTQDFTHAESWQPKVAIFQWSRANTSANAFQEHASVGYGFTDGTNQRAVAFATEDNQARGDSARIQRDNCLIVTLNPSGTIETVDSVATFNSWLSNGIRVNWTDQPAANFYITCTLLGGADITNVLVGTFMTTTGSGDVSYTSASFEADYGMFLSGGTGTLNSPVISGSMMLGMATGTSGNVNQWVQSIYSLDNPATMATYQYYSHSKIFEIHTTATDGYATFSGFNSTGFTVNIGDTFSTSFPIFFLIIKGGSFTVGNATEPASTGQQTITTNKDVKIVGLFGLDTGTPDAVQTGCMWTSGFEDWYNGIGAFVFEDTNGAANSIVVSRYITGASYMNITANVTATSSTIDDECSLYSVPTSTSFTLNWSNVGQARPFRYCTYGSGLISVTKSLTLKFEGIQQITKQLTLKQDILQAITKQLTLRNDITNQIIKRLILRQNIGTDTPSFRSAVVSYLLDTSAGNKDITFSQSPAWTPKAALVFISQPVSANETFAEGLSIAIGFTDGTTSSNWGFFSTDNVSASNTSHHNNTNLLEAMNPVTTRDFVSTFVSWLSNGMRINVSNALSQSAYINVLFLGGDDLEAAYVGNRAMPGIVGNVVVNTVGFKPTLLFLGSNSFSLGSYTNGNAWFSFGVTNGVNQWAESRISTNTANPTSVTSTYHMDRCHNLNNVGRMQFSSFDDNGFTLYCPDAYVNSYPFFYLALKIGSQTAVGEATEPSTIGSQKVTTGILSDCGLIIGDKLAAPGVTTDFGHLSLGIFSNDTNQSSEVIDELDNVSPTVLASRHSNSKVYQNITANATAANSTINDLAEALYLDDTGFALDWTKVGSARTFRYVTIGRKLPTVTKTLTLLQNINTEISKSTTLKFDLYQETTKILNLLYNVEGALLSITKTLNLLFSVNTPITKTTTIKWEVLQEVSRQLSIIFDGAGKVTKTLTLLHNILQEVTKTNTLRFDITVPVEKSLTLLFSGFVEVTKTLTLLFNEIGQITKILTLRFDELQEVSRQLTLRFDEIGQITKTLTLRHDVLQETEKSMTLRFDTLKEITKSLTLRHDIIGQITKILTLLYNVESATLTATKSLTLLFSGIGQTTKSTTVRFDISTIISRTLTLRQDIRTEIERLLTLKFNTEEEVTKSTTLLFSIIQQITKTLTLRNDILTQTTKSLTLRNDILTEAMKTITLRQNILQEAVKSLSLRFGIEGPIVKTLTLRFDVIAETTKSITLKFNILQDVTKQLNLLFTIIGQTTKSLTIPFSIEAEVTKTVTLIQNIVGEVLRTVTLRFDVLKETSKSLTLRQDIIQETTKSVTLRQNILSEVEKDVTILYGILQEVPIVSKTLRFNIEQQITKQLRLLSDIQAQTTKQLRIRFDVKSILIKNMAEKLLDCLFNRYTLALPTKSSILWHEWYNGQNDICISCLPMTVIPIERESTMVYKKRHYVCSLHLFYRHVVDNPNENTPTQLANLTRHIHNLLLANRFNPNFLGAIDAKAVEVRIRDADYIPDPDERGTGVPSPRIYHYRWILEIVYHKIV